MHIFGVIRIPQNFTNLLDLPLGLRTAIWHHVSERLDVRYSHFWDPDHDNSQDQLRLEGLGGVPVEESGWPLHPLLQLNHQYRK